MPEGGTKQYGLKDSTTKYPAEGAPVKSFGGNSAIHDGVRTTQDPAASSKGSGSPKGSTKGY